MIGTLQAEPAAAPSVAPERRRARPVLWWAGIGAILLALEAYVIGDWILSGNAKPTPVGPSPVPTYMKVSLTLWHIIGGIAFVWVVWRFLVMPWRRERRLSFDGMLVIAWGLGYWQDPLSNYGVRAFSYNAWMPNLGNWTSSLPGASAPNSNLVPEPLLLTGPLFVWMLFGFSVTACHLMRMAKQRWPQLSPWGLCVACFVGFVVFDFVLEVFCVWTGYFAYPSTIKSLTVFWGRYYQFPIYEAILWGLCWALGTCLRYYRDDKGHAVVERGIDRVHTGRRTKTLLRFLALSGALNVIMLVGYNLPFQVISSRATGWPRDFVSRSYFTNGVCGPGTTFECPGEGVPLVRAGAARVGPDGTLVTPAGKETAKDTPLQIDPDRAQTFACDPPGVCHLVPRQPGR